MDKANWASLQSNTDYMAVVKGLELKGNSVVPDLKGMGLRDALYLLEERKLKVQVKGKGKVVSQSIPPGTTVQPKQSITIELH